MFVNPLKPEDIYITQGIKGSFCIHQAWQHSHTFILKQDPTIPIFQGPKVRERRREPQRSCGLTSHHLCQETQGEQKAGGKSVWN